LQKAKIQRSMAIRPTMVSETTHQHLLPSPYIIADASREGVQPAQPCFFILGERSGWQEAWA
jgi:hypothetical protein